MYWASRKAAERQIWGKGAFAKEIQLGRSLSPLACEEFVQDRRINRGGYRRAQNEKLSNAKSLRVVFIDLFEDVLNRVPAHQFGN